MSSRCPNTDECGDLKRQTFPARISTVAREWSLCIFVIEKNTTIVARCILPETFVASQIELAAITLHFQSPRDTHIDDRALTWFQRRFCDENRRPVVIQLLFSSPDCKALRSYIRITLAHSFVSSPKYTATGQLSRAKKCFRAVATDIAIFQMRIPWRRSSVAISRRVELLKSKVSIKLILRQNGGCCKRTKQ